MGADLSTAATVTLHDSSGEYFDAEIVSVERDPSGVFAVTFQVDQRAWDHINAEELFHTDLSRRIGDVEGNFGPGNPVIIEAMLDELVVESLELTEATADELRERLVAPDPEGLDQFLLSARSWLARTVTQEVPLPEELADKGSIREGFRMESPD